MLEIITAMTFLEKVFLTSALCGSVVFGIRMVMMFIGLTGDDSDADIDTDSGDGGQDLLDDAPGDFDGDTDLDGSHELAETASDTDLHESHDCTDASFKFLSLQGLTAFFMMFGWVGLAIIRDSGLPGWAAIIGGSAAGIFTVYILSFLFRFMLSMQSDGTMKVRHAIGSGGRVYLRIPVEGTGQVEVEVDGRLRIFDAVSSDKEELKTGDQVTVVWVQDNGVLVVEKDERERGGKLCGP